MHTHTLMASSFSLICVFAIAFLFFSSSTVLSKVRVGGGKRGGRGRGGAKARPPKFKDEEEKLLQNLNSYRQALYLPLLANNAKADCIAKEIADDAEDQPCTVTTVASSPSQITKFPDYAEKCKVNINTTVDAVVMPVCVPKLVHTQLLANYTHSQYTKYLTDSRFIGVGLGAEDDWMVVVLTTGAPTGSFASSKDGSLMVSIGGSVSLVLLGFFILGIL